MRKLIILATIAILLTGCATNYSSIETKDGESEIIVGKKEILLQAIESAISEEFPKSAIHDNKNGFSWRNTVILDFTDFNISISPTSGNDKGGKEVVGYSYKVTTDGTQPLVSIRYVKPLTVAIQKSISNQAALKIVSVSSFKKLSLPSKAQERTPQSQVCFDTLEKSSELDPVREKISISSATNQSFERLTNNTKATAQEKQAIKFWGNGRERCYAVLASENKENQTDSQIMGLMESYISNQQSILAQLYLGNITYGEFASKRQLLANTTNEAIIKIQDAYIKEYEDSEARARQIAAQAEQNSLAAINSFGQTMQMLQMQQQINQNHTYRLKTTCSQLGTTIFCN